MAESQKRIDHPFYFRGAATYESSSIPPIPSMSSTDHFIGVISCSQDNC